MTKLLWRQCAIILKLFHHYGQVVAARKPESSRGVFAAMQNWKADK
jgi:hypothetical protein